MIGYVVGPAVESDVCRAPQAIELDELSDYRTNDPNTKEFGSVKLSNFKRDLGLTYAKRAAKHPITTYFRRREMWTFHNM